ncbi:hypothetical protein HanHA89_Chr05g0200911 [Helianthus annuus]|nr:hypothetical protein HanHA89_Chr05g0200911 [Helianthus annuus]
MTAALAANFRHSIVTSLLSAIIFSRKVLITDCYRMNRDGYTVCSLELLEELEEAWGLQD